jgi:predicted ArsR family transcriptional regulator
MNKRTAARRTAAVERLPRPHAASDPSGRGSGEPHGRRDLILSMLRESARPLSITEIAAQFGVHPNTVRFHLDALIDAGRVERTLGDPAGPGRPPMLFWARREMDRNGPSNYRLLAEILTGNLAATAADPAIAATALGRAWGASVTDQSLPRAVATKGEAVTQLVGLLDDLGFEPEPDRGGRTSQIRLRHCPFLELIDDHADVICSLHLGLMQGAMKAMTASVTVNRLEPFVEPDLCVAHLTSTGARS